ncbi:hypothetical protein [Deinococcus sp. YIM 77859]|uniref:hypothetical protein n=1 Tax=Deinococcus sp. YIM 77859 TaxID=1540221 RepID=UPI00054F82F5|nr:hypothetical protein [Deinococcus sp. YIM 77859]
MESTKLTHSTIGNLQGGGIGYVIDDAINRAMQDCERRPGLKKARVVNIQIEFTPVVAQGLDGKSDAFSTVGVTPKVAVKVPLQAADAEFLHVSPGVTADGEPEIAAVFSQEDLFVALKEGN